MVLYYSIVFFVFGTIFGSFFNVVGSRLPKGESIIKPSSHCDKCKHKLTPIELIPIFSFLIQGGKCKNCGTKLSWFYPFYELFTGICFLLSYLSFGISFDLIIAITFISCILIIIVSDIEYMIISDEVLIFFTILLIIELLINNGFILTLYSIINGIISFIIMLLIKKLGDFLFKKESMGGGDIKLLFLFGLVLGWPIALLSIFLGSIIGLPISLIIMLKNKSNVIPFGPFLGIGAMILILIQFNTDKLLLLFS